MMKASINYNRIARIFGALYIAGTVAGGLSAVFSGPILTEPDSIAEVLQAAHDDHMQLRAGAFFVLVMAVSLSLLPVVGWAVFEKVNRTLAVGMLLFRGALEGAAYMVAVVGMLLMIPLADEYVVAGADAASYEAAGHVVLASGDATGYMIAVSFIIGALFLYVILWQSRLVPRWMSGWGLVASAPYLAASLLAMLGVLEDRSGLQIALFMPLAIQEMVMGLWLVVRGFKREAVDRLEASTG